MAKVEKIDKWLDSSEKESPKPVAKDYSIPRSKKIGKTATKQNKKSTFVTSNELINKIQTLLKESPDTPEFFGKRKLTLKAPKRKLFRRKNYPDLTSLRVDLNKLSVNGKVDIHNRQKVRNDLKNYPDVPDLHVINAIYTYQDIPKQNEKMIMSTLSQNKLNEHQLSQLKRAINQIVLAFHNGGLNVFNVNWFIKIYLEHLNAYKGRLTYEYNGIQNRRDKVLMELAQRVKDKQSEIINLMSIKDKLGGITRLTRRLNGTSYLSDSFSPLEIRKAAIAVQNGDPTKTIVKDRTAAKTIFVLMTLLFLLAKIPILKDLVEDILKTIPDDDRGLLLRKRMVLTIILMAEFERLLSSSNKDLVRENGDKLYAYCLNTINDYTRGKYLKEQYEIDPYLKATWLIIASNGFHSKQKYKEMLAQGYTFMQTISGEQNHLKEPHRETIIEIASRYIYQLDSIMDLHGWLSEKDGESWRKRD